MDLYRVKRVTLDPADAIQNRHAGKVYDPAIMAYRPQRMSISSTKSAISWDPQDQFSESRPESRRSSTSSYASFASTTSIASIAQTNATSTASRMGSRRSSFSAQQKSRSTQPPSPVFKRLPLEIYECILQQLKVVHSEQYIQSCPTCYLRDLYNLALTSRMWDRAVRVQLYDKIHIVGHDSPAQLKKFKMKTGVRLKLLRRTLRERRVLAQLVHELKVPNLQTGIAGLDRETIDLVASLVMACPNLEKLIGFYPTFNHEFNRLTHALSTRRRLREHIWIIGENDAITQRSMKQLPPGLMDVEQVDSFLHYHSSWPSLTTLVLHSHDQGVLEHDIFIEIFQHLPSLRHLYISSFDIDDFNDLTLEYLPPLQSLRLESLPGITDRGLSRFATAPAAQNLQRLSLIHLPIKSLLTISRILAHLTQVARFTLIQESSPTIPTDELIFQPIVASPALTFLHWDILSPGDTASSNLAASIRAGGFPSLRTIRAPSDHIGQLQALCKPRAQIVLPSDKYNTTHKKVLAVNPTARTLYAARQAAQSRIDDARNIVQFKVIVEEEGVVKHILDFPGFMGTVGSRISYSLKGDVAGSEDAVAGIADLRRGEGDGREGCTGMWNASHHAGKRWWWHRERGRWKDVGLDSVF